MDNYGGDDSEPLKKGRKNCNFDMRKVIIDRREETDTISSDEGF